jgi:hypothetical protein
VTAGRGASALSPMTCFRNTVLASCALSLTLRLRFFWSPMTADEGGFLAIARAWHHGRSLYTEVWVERPQVLLIIFRITHVVSGDSVLSVRFMAWLFSCLAVVSVANLVKDMHGARSGALAAVIVAVAISAPVLEGFTASGELLSGAIGSAALAVAVRAISSSRTVWPMAGAGSLAVLAIGTKQSAYDAGLAIGLWLGAALLLRWTERPRAWHLILAFAGGAMATLGAIVAQATSFGIRKWWFAVAEYRLNTRSALHKPDWHRLRVSAGRVLPVIGPLAAVVMVGSILLMSQAVRGRRIALRPALLLPLWCLCAGPAFMTGGQFFEHYWVLPAFPLAAGAAVLLGDRLRPRALAMCASALVLMPALLSTVQIISLDRAEIPIRVGGYHRAVREERVGAWFRDTAQPNDTLYVMCASASAYAAAHTDPPFPYLWMDSIRAVPGAAAGLEALVAGVDRPTYIAIFQDPSTCAPRGPIAKLVAANYRQLITVDRIPILVAKERPKDA